MKEEKKSSTLRLNKFRYLAQAFVFCYVGWFGVESFTNGISQHNIFSSVMWGVWVSFMLAIFSYGVICLIVDFKKGGIREIIKKWKDFKNGEF